MKDSYLTAGIRFWPLVRLLRRNHVSFRVKYILRTAFLLQSAAWSSGFGIAERIRYGKILDRTPVPRDPVFIIGHWRTGSTFLHQLMNCDPGFTAPTLFQVAQPDSFLSSYRYYKPLFRSLVSRHRPMDNVRLGMNEPQEDEYALYRMTCYSPLEKLIFPEKKGYFLTGLNTYLPPADGLPEWEQQLTHFMKKISFQTGRRIVSKNPFNSLRIETLLRLFPEARFIHIVRNPLNSVPSSVHMWSIVQKQNCLNIHQHTPTIPEVCDVMNFMMEKIGENVGRIPHGRFAEVRYEDLEQDPAGVLRQLYGSLGIPFTEEFDKKTAEFLSGVVGYRKNTFELSGSDRRTIGEKMKNFMSRYGYNS